MLVSSSFSNVSSQTVPVIWISSYTQYSKRDERRCNLGAEMVKRHMTCSWRDSGAAENHQPQCLIIAWVLLKICTYIDVALQRFSQIQLFCWITRQFEAEVSWTTLAGHFWAIDVLWADKSHISVAVTYHMKECFNPTWINKCIIKLYLTAVTGALNMTTKQ